MRTTGYGLCECGCGNRAPVADRNHAKYGYVKGEPKRFIRGHAMKGKLLSAAQREEIGARFRGKPKSVEQRAKMSAAQLGPRGNNWQGGRIIREGRVLVYVGRERALADTYGYAYEHRLVLAAALGRCFRPEEDVHHVDLDQTNNATTNLVALTSSEHTRVHNLVRAGCSPFEALRKAVELSRCV